MSMNKFAGIQQLGRALMLPIAVLPVAGLLLRLGQPDLLNIAWLAQAGGAIFDNLALIFAIGVAVGFAKENNGTAGLAGVVGYLILTSVLKALDDKINMGVLSGIIMGLVAGGLYNRYKDIKLPPYLAFFGGKRFVPIATGLSSVVLGLVFSVVWPPIQNGIDAIGHWLINAGSIGLFVYGVLNRLLIVTGLHHILNSLVWFVFGSFPGAAGKIATGDLNRFFAGDPTAGAFMAGFFPIMMFGLPAACLAMYRCAKTENKKAVAGLLLSMALTAFLTGVTEPVEFGFMFLAPVLYAIHAVLTGLSMVIAHLLHIRLGFTFSAGLFDYLLSSGKGENPLLMLPVGLVYFVVYYVVFSFAIRKFNLMTPGREDNAPVVVDQSITASDRARGFITALGGAANLKSVDACTTRLRLEVVDGQALDEAALKALGSRGMIRPAAGSVQVVIGPEADLVADEIRQALHQMQGAQAAPSSTPNFDRARWTAALGGESNIFNVEQVAGTRLRVEVADSGRVDETALKSLGAVEVVPFSSTLLHVVLAGDADQAVSALSQK
ncbi:N-acetylglucosamine-specific PTS transporter subunit IIBC [Paludibacterium purpuratum]|uniref:PTS system N-acetylglucosamine-specific IIB component (Glc family) /PTS system N-acetylglucosamine-specific IIC component (Glc family) n=1 Tax=Paludibacterium purpuratum TaxID=1144873 RepID=A0A4R7B736_9NEIS|nr:N-acetylglucosamine-specific PTS transporter subunit IIBC [Paludibacterium purpuratum]TDR80550.1 PTS system N-acetylglucosamine-specific IIB component (Glc family) /PTS system N-acetylglucosamine-specific IIC component (Glc family) [Paludibacterium purpuratum]